MTKIQQIVLATSNLGKIAEFKLAATQKPIEFLNQTALGIPDIEETGLSFIENALLKARHTAKFTSLPVIADDSGLMVDALNGAPGIYSARVAGKNASRDEKNLLILNELKKLNLAPEKRTARLYCCLVFLRKADDPLPIIVEATWEGLIAENIQGSGGFGYEPIFYLPELQRRAAQLSPQEKLQLSHRGKALQVLFEKILISPDS